MNAMVAGYAVWVGFQTATIPAHILEIGIARPSVVAMLFLSWRQVDFPGVLLAGLAAGYVMAIVGIWAGKFPGLVAIDIADFGRRYMISDRPSAWLIGLGSHLANSILLTFAWAAVIAPNLPGPPVLSAVLWGEFLAFTLSGALVAPMSGLGFLGLKTGSFRFALTNIVMHTAWGLLIGLLYVP